MSSFEKPRVPEDSTDINDTHDLLEQIIKELKIMNTHFAEWDGDENERD